MLYTFLIILLVLDSLVLVVAILLQAGKGGATSAADSLMGTRQAGNLLTRTSWWCGGIFLLLAFVLQIASARPGAPSSVLDKSLNAAPAAPAPAPSTDKNTAVPLEAAPKQPVTPAPTTPAPKTP
jgi:preprotein translocase subunit SecG